MNNNYPLDLFFDQLIRDFCSDFLEILDGSRMKRRRGILDRHLHEIRILNTGHGAGLDGFVFANGLDDVVGGCFIQIKAGAAGNGKAPNTKSKGIRNRKK